MALNKACVTTGDFLDRNQSSASANAARYKPLLAAHGDGHRKRFSDTPIDSLRLVPTNGRGDVSSSYLSGKFSFYPRPRKQQRSLDGCTGARNSTTLQVKERGNGNTAFISRQVKFDWSAYLKEINTSPVPFSFFIHLPSDFQVDSSLLSGVSDALSLSTRESAFKVDQYLEGIDPHQESLFCVLKVAEVVGRRLRLRFVGYIEKYDFWTTIDSPFLFPVGWCAHNNRSLQPPKSYLDRGQTSFNWENFLSRVTGVAAPRHLFRIPWTCTVNEENVNHLFRVGDKLEAIDKRNPTTVCVATVKDCIGDHLLIRFDGWESSFDQWAHTSSELLHPVGFCEDQELVLSIPREWSVRSEGFTWKQYLKETHSKQVPLEAFQKVSGEPRLSHLLKVGQRLEAVDRRCPQLIRVAHIAGVSRSGFVDIAFDGWSDKFNLCLESSCTGLFPVGYCQTTGHPLQLPPGYDLDTTSADVNGANELLTTIPPGVGSSGAGASLPSQNVVASCCPTPGCKGYGHVKGPRFSSHQRISGCPYADVNLRKDFIRGYERLAYTSILPVTSDSSLVGEKADESSGTRVNGGLPTRTSIQTIVDGDTTSSLSSGQTDATPPPALSLSTTDSSLMKSLNSLSNNPLSPRSPGFPMDQSAEVIPPVPDEFLSYPDGACNYLNHVPVQGQGSISTDEATGTKEPTCPSLSQAVPQHNALTASITPHGRLLDGIAPPGVVNTADVLPPSLTEPSQVEPPVLMEQPMLTPSPVDATPKVDAINSNIHTAASAISNAHSKLSDESYQRFENASNLPFGPNASPTTPDGVQGLTDYRPNQGKPCSNQTVKWEQARQYKQRPAQTASDFHLQHQQQSVANSVSGLMPVKRKRGRPRKLTNSGLGLVQSTPMATATSSVRPPSGPKQRSTLAQQTAPYPSAFTTVLISGQHSQPIMTSFGQAYSSTGTSSTHVMSPFANAITSVSASNECAVISPSHLLDVSVKQDSIGQLATATGGSEMGGPTCYPPVGMPVLDPVHTSGNAIAAQFGGYCNEDASNVPLHQSTMSRSTAVTTTSPGPVGTNSLSRPISEGDQCLSNANRLLPGLVDSLVPRNLSWCATEPGGAPLSSFCQFQLELPGPLQNSQHPVFSSAGQTFPAIGVAPSLPMYQVDARQQDSVNLLNRLLPQAGAALQAAKAAGLAGPHSWSVEMVAHFVATLPGCKQFSSKFTENEIDGAALLCLEQRDLMHILGMRLGPAVKVSSAIQTLRRGLLATPLSELSVDQSGAFAAVASCFNLSTASPGVVVGSGGAGANGLTPPNQSPSTTNTTNTVFRNPSGDGRTSLGVQPFGNWGTGPDKKSTSAAVTHRHDPTVSVVFSEGSG